MPKSSILVSSDHQRTTGLIYVHLVSYFHYPTPQSLTFCCSTMGTAYELCNELFSWIDKQEQFAEDLTNLADELEEIVKAKSKRQLLKNIGNVFISSSMLVSGLALLFLLPEVFVGVGAGFMLSGYGSSGLSTLIPLKRKIVKKWKSSKAMENAEKTADEIEKILNKIERLQKKMTKQCEIQGLKASSSDEVQCEITARILKAIARRMKKDLPLNCLRHLLRNEDIASEIHLDKTFFRNVSILLTMIGYSFFTLKTITQTDQVTEGVLGLVLTLPGLVNNCEKLIKNKHQPEAINFLKTKANEICDAMMKLRTQLNDIQKILHQMECNINFPEEIVGSQIYKGTIYIKYKHDQYQAQIEKFIVICSKDIGQKDIGVTCSSVKHKLNGKNESQESTISEDSTSDGVDKRKKCQTVMRRTPRKVKMGD
ncbi:hypothetical protein AMELA_G00018030 [Ameiurus melas]|uniref:Uncharacterized protein n=1 Tax=Ameiurus melas TaxID=219545 RepID=A0A7J6BCW7_AMEME|nr:hypothetical protein AMELA_G00018030 [Ameiurus melas]